MTRLKPVEVAAGMMDMTAAELREVKDGVSKAKAILILDHIFFGSIVSKRPIIYTTAVPTAAMAARGQMYINPYFVRQLPLQQKVFLLAHEALHFMLSHSLRMGSRNPEAWNIACDKVINEILRVSNVGEIIPGTCAHEGAHLLAAEDLYDPEDAQSPSGKQGEGGGEGDANGGIGGDIGEPMNDDGSPMDASEASDVAATARIEAIQASTIAKMTGKLPAHIAQLVGDLTAVKTPWHVILERYMVSLVREGRSWARPNRRFISRGLYLPGDDYVPKMGPVVIGADTSGSVSMQEWKVFGGHVNRILETCRPEMIYIVHCDAQIAKVEEFTPDDLPIPFNRYGGGGTMFQPVFDWVDQNRIDPEVIVYLTDGYGDQHHFKSSHDTVWLTTGTTDFPWGQVIPFEMDN